MTKYENTVECLLRCHPGVCDVAAFRMGVGVKAFVVPDDSYIDQVMGRAIAGSNVLSRWRKAFDLTQFAKDAAAAPLGMNISGWNSSYTRKPIPSEQMHEWVDFTVADIMPLQPKSICELGCGTGMLLMKIAPHCDRYIGVDFSAVVLSGVRKQLRHFPKVAERVQLREGKADDFHVVDRSSVNAVVINSVVQYFPSISYLTKVIQNAVGMVKDEGHVFVGDVPSLPLLPLFASSVALYQSQDEITVEQWRDRAHRRIEMEQQLIVSPAYFLSLRGRDPRISSVEIRPRRDRGDTEMSRYRYQAILHVGHNPPSPEVEFLEMAGQEWTADEIRSVLLRHRGAFIGFTQIPNSRLQYDLAMLAELKTAESTVTAGELRRTIDQTAKGGFHPQDLIDLGTSFGFQVLLSWLACRSDGSYDAVFVPTRFPQDSSCFAIKWPEPNASGLVHLANSPGQKSFRRALLDELWIHCRQNLSTSMVPDDITLVDTLGSLGHGKPDPMALLAAQEVFI